MTGKTEEDVREMKDFWWDLLQFKQPASNKYSDEHDLQFFFLNDRVKRGN